MSTNGFLISVPRELAINTNYPNVSSVLIDPSSNDNGLRRSKRRTGLDASKNNPQPTPKGTASDGRPAQQNRDFCTKEDAQKFSEFASDDQRRERKKVFRSMDQLSTPHSPLNPSKLETSDSSTPPPVQVMTKIPDVIRNWRISHPLSKIEEASTVSDRSRTNIHQNSHNPASYCPIQNSSDNGIINNNPRNLSHPKRNRGRRLPSPNPPLEPTAIQASTSSSSTSSKRSSTCRAAAARKTSDRVFTNRDARYDAYGTVRFEASDDIILANSTHHQQWIEGMLQIETLRDAMKRGREKQRKRSESERKLWEVGKRMPWVLSRFRSYEEYEEWCTAGRKTIVESLAANADTGAGMDGRNELQEYWHGDTTEEEELEEEESASVAEKHNVDGEDSAGPSTAVGRIKGEDAYTLNRTVNTSKALMYGGRNTVALSTLADLCVEVAQQEH